MNQISFTHSSEIFDIRISSGRNGICQHLEITHIQKYRPFIIIRVNQWINTYQSETPKKLTIRNSQKMCYWTSLKDIQFITINGKLNVHRFLVILLNLHSTPHNMLNLPLNHNIKAHLGWSKAGFSSFFF